MKELHCDLETFSSADLSRTGIYRYAESPDFEILLFGYSVDAGPVQVVDLANGELLPVEIRCALTDPFVTKWAFNASFERICLSRFLGLPSGEYLDPHQWRCSMIWSAYLGLPLSLAGVGAVLKLEKQKIEAGKDLIKNFCQPCAPTKTNGGRARNRAADALDKWALFKSYNLRDVETEMAIQEKLARFSVPDFVWDEYHLDQEINDRGIRLDMQLVNSAIRMDELSREELTVKMQALTALDNPNSVAQMKAWLADNGLELESLGKKELAASLKNAPEGLTDVLLLRQQLAKTSVKKYQAMRNCVCDDSRAHGMFMFYGANRTGRYSGRLIQLQNLPQNHMTDLKQARALVRGGDYGALHSLYDSVPDVLSELIRTAFVPYEGGKFIIADFSAIEARVIAWLAGEQWRLDVFQNGGDIYCASASQMFKVPVEKHGINGHLRQKGKIAELACIAEGQLVLTNHGEKPIETVTTDDLLWDSEGWVLHEGLIYKGEREIITYEGLSATRDHLVWVEGKPEPVQFGIAVSCGAHLVQTGYGGKPIRLGKDYFSGKTVEQDVESLLCADSVRGLRINSMAEPKQFAAQYLEGLSTMLSAETNPTLAGKTVGCSKTTMRESKKLWVSQLWRTRHSVRFCECHGSRALPNSGIRSSEEGGGNRSHQYKWRLCNWESSVRDTCRQLLQSAKMCAIAIQTTILALCTKRGHQEVVQRGEPRRNYQGCRDRRVRETKKLAVNQRKARVYDIRNAGEHHSFTVSGRLVHNCGYGGSVGAMKAMGGMELGLTEAELKKIVADWRVANPNIVKLWWDVDKAAKMTVSERVATETHGLRFLYESGFLFIQLPSGRRLAYVKPRIGENKFGGESVTYEGIGATKKWERLESYGPKFVENSVQAISRDILCYAMKTLRCCNIVAHVHDEIIIEADPRMSLQAICEQMGRTPPWAKGLILRADGFEAQFYQKD